MCVWSGVSEGERGERGEARAGRGMGQVMQGLHMWEDLGLHRSSI